MSRRSSWPAGGRATMLLLTIGVLLAGCGANASGTSEADVGAVDSPPPGCSAVTAGHLNSGDAVTAALTCTSQPELVPGKGEWLVAVNKRATGGLAALLAALRLPSQPHTDGPCTLELRMPTEIQLEVNGAAVSVGTPKDVCGQTRSEVIAAFSAMSWVEVSRTKVQQVRNEAAVAAGCEPWKDILAISAAEARPGTPGPIVTTDGVLKVCRYRSIYPAGWTQTSNQVVDGEVTDGTTLSVKASGQVTALLNSAGPATACTKRHTRFAVVQPGGSPVYVELDGCLRILAPDGALRQGDKHLVGLLTGS